MQKSLINRYVIQTAILSVLALSCGQQPPQTDFPIMAWYGPDYKNSTEKTFQDLQTCGFTINYSLSKTRELNHKALEFALQNKIKLLVSDARINVDKILQDSTAITAIDSMVLDYIVHPALFGYFISNEPSAKYFPALARIVNYMRSKYPTHLPYINIFPIYATPVQLGVQTYTEYIERFMEVVHPPILSYHHYPIIEEGIRNDYFDNLEIIRAVALKYKVPFWGCTLSVMYGPYPKPHQGHLRFQLYCNLAYGAKGLQYFTYKTPQSDRWDFQEAPLDTNGNKTTTYRNAQFINREMHKLAPVLQNLQSTAVYHTTPVPSGCQALAPGLAIEFVKDGELVIGFFQDNKKRPYVMIVNRDHLSGVMPRVYFAQNVRGITEVSKTMEKSQAIKFKTSESEKSVLILLKAGEGRLFRLHK